MRMRIVGMDLEVTLYVKKFNKKVMYTAKNHREAFEIASELLK